MTRRIIANSPQVCKIRSDLNLHKMCKIRSDLILHIYQNKQTKGENMADTFKVRIVATPDANRKDEFKKLVEILSNAADNYELDLGELCDGF